MIMAVPHATVLHGSGTEGLSYRPGKAVSAKQKIVLIATINKELKTIITSLLIKFP